jgi:hypothetical protein
MTDADLLELTELCNALADDCLTGAQRARLNERLAASEEARVFYVRFAGLNASLCDYASELQCERPAPPKPKLIRHPMAWWAGIGALAASVVAVLHFTHQPVADEAPSVAWLTGAKDARWNESSGPQPGDSLERGRHLDLRSGLAEVTFDSGARVVLEGPASFDVESAWAASLKSGVLTASAPSEAAGFRVANTTVAVTNLGGDVRIETDRTGGTEVVALTGSAEAAAPGRAEKLLLKGRQARRFAGGSAMPVADLDQKLSRFAARARLERNGRPVEITRGANARTVAFWVRIPQDAAPGQQAEIAGFGHKKSGPLRVAWNTAPEHGPLGALLTEHDGEKIVGHTSLRDGEWHHVAVMIVGGRKTGRLELKQYVDGRLEGSAMLARRKFEAGDAREFVHVGEPVSGGTLDKLFFADRPLTPFELRTLIDTNALPGGV